LGDVESRRILLRSNEAHGCLFGLSQNEFDLVGQDLLLLLLADTLEVLGLLEEALSSGGNLGLVDTPVFTKSVEDVALVVEHLDGTLLGNVL